MPYPGTATPIPADGITLYPHPKLTLPTTVKWASANGVQGSQTITGPVTATGDVAEHLLGERGQRGAETFPVVSTTPNCQALMLGLGPKVYYPMDAAWGPSDRMAYGSDLFLADAASRLGAAAGPLATLDYGGTDFNGSSMYVAEAGYTPFVNGTTRTLFGWAQADTMSGSGGILYSTNGASWAALQIIGPAGDAFWYAGAAFVASWGIAWPSDTAYHFWTLSANDTLNTTELTIDGVSKGVVNTAFTFGADPGISVWGSIFATQWWDGKMAHIGVVEGPVTAAQAAAVYAAR